MAKHTQNGTGRAPHIRRVPRWEAEEEFEAPRNPADFEKPKHVDKSTRRSKPKALAQAKAKAKAEGWGNVGGRQRGVRIALGLAAAFAALRLRRRAPWAGRALGAVAFSALETGLTGYCPATSYLNHHQAV